MVASAKVDLRVWLWPLVGKTNKEIEEAAIEKKLKKEKNKDKKPRIDAANKK